MVPWMAKDGPAGNYAISLFGSQPPGMDAVTKRWEIRERYLGGGQQTGRFTRVVLTLSRVNTNAQGQYIHWTLTLSVILGRSEEVVTQWNEMHIRGLGMPGHKMHKRCMRAQAPTQQRASPCFLFEPSLLPAITSRA